VELITVNMLFAKSRTTLKYKGIYRTLIRVGEKIGNGEGKETVISPL